MKFYQNFKKLSMWIAAFFFVAAIIIFREIISDLPSVFRVVGQFLSIISPFIAGFVIAFVLYIPCVKVENLLKKTKSAFINKHARGISVTVVYCLGVAVIAVVLVLVLPWLVRSLIGLYNNREIYSARISDFIYSRCDENGTFFGIDPASITNVLNFEKYLTNINFEHLTSVANGVYKVGSAVVETILAIFSSIYMLSSREVLLRSVGRFFTLFAPKKKVLQTHNYLGKIAGIFYTYIYSTLLDALIVAVVCTIVFLIIGVDYAPLFGFIVGIANIIPYFGAIVAGVGVAAFTAVTDGILSALITAIAILVIQQIDGNILQPKVVGKTVGIPPLYTLMAITIGGGLFGFGGILLGVPVAATLQMIVSDVLDIREKRMLEHNTNDNNS